MLQHKVSMSSPRVPTILVVDDTEVVRKSAARCLRRRGYLVLEAGGVAEALSLVTSNSGQKKESHNDDQEKKKRALKEKNGKAKWK